MNLDVDIVRKLAHSGLKTLGSISDLLELYDMDSSGGLHDLQTRKIFHRSIQALSQAIRDLQLLAICEETDKEKPEAINWDFLLKNALSGRLSETITVSIEDGNYEGSGYSNLVTSAFRNLGLFAKRFWKNPVKVKLRSVMNGTDSWISIDWEFGNSIIIDQEFSKFLPFFPMFPKESLALEKSTGLSLCTVQRIIELHRGKLTAHCDENFKLEWACPKNQLQNKN